MKKILLFFSAVLVSLAMQATIAKQEIDLSGLSAYGTATVSGGSVTGAKEWHGAQRYYNDNNADALNRGDYTYVCVELESVATSTIRLQVEYTDDDGTAAQYVDIPVGAKSKALSLTGTYIKTIEILNWTGNGGVSFTISKLYLYKQVGKKSTTSIYKGTHTAATDWEHSYENLLLISGDEFASIHDGDSLSITYTSDANASCNAHLAIGLDLMEIAGTGNLGIALSQSTPATVSVALHGSDIENLQTNGIYFEGINYTLTDVSLITYAQHVLVERTLNTGYDALTWDGIYAHWDDIPTVYEGDELRATVVANDGTGNYQLYFLYDWSHDALTTDVAVDGTVNKIYTKTLTAEEAAAINVTHDLLIRGTGLTLSRFAIAQSMSIYDDNMLWRGETAVTTWGNPVSKPADKFANISVGDVINVTLSSVTAGGQLWLTKSDATHFTPKPHYIFNSNWVAPLTISCVVNQDMVTDLQAGGLLISGENFTITSVHIIEASARQESYELTVGDAGMATLVLPFNVQYLPTGVEAYELSNSGSSDIFATQVNAIEADKPVLIIASAGTYTFYSENGANADISGKYAAVDGNYMNGALVGNYVQSTVPTTQPNTYNYVLQQPGEEAPAFYQVQDASCTVAPYRAYLSCSYPGGGGAGAPMRIVFRQQTPTDMEALTAEGQEPSALKVLRDGKLFIIRNGVMYNVNGQIIQ